MAACYDNNAIDVAAPRVQTCI